MNPERLQALLDGELSAEEAHAVRAELARSPELEAELDALLQLDAHASALAEQGADIPRAAPRRAWIAAVAACAAAALVGFVVFLSGQGGAEDELERYVAGLDTRLAVVRVSHPSVDTYRPYAPYLGPKRRTRTPPAALLAALEAEGDRRAIAALYMLSGHAELASHYLDGADDADDRSDRAALAYLSGDFAGALEHADAALALAPEHPQAWWNRALALEALGRDAAAIEAYEAAAARSSPKWAEAARRRAAALR